MADQITRADEIRAANRRRRELHDLFADGDSPLLTAAEVADPFAGLDDEVGLR